MTRHLLPFLFIFTFVQFGIAPPATAQITWDLQNNLDVGWQSVAYGNGIYVAVRGEFADNRVMTSTDGVNWTLHASGVNKSWGSVTFGNGLFVAVSRTFPSNQVMTSPDGINWTSRISAADIRWNCITYGNGLFVAVGDGGTGNLVMTSPDGINWTSRASAADNYWNSVTYGNGLFVATAISGIGNRVMTSPDGISWTIRTSAANNQWYSVTYGNGLFVAVATTGTGSRVMTSPDGINWTIRTSAADNSWWSVTYGNGLFVATATTGTGNRVMTSPDGINWTIRTSAADNEWRSVIFNNGLFLAVANSGEGNRVMTSPDGIDWTAISYVPTLLWQSVTYGNGLFVAVATTGTGNRVMTSPDGINWARRTSAADNQWYSVTYGNGLFVAVAITGAGNRVMTSPDGINWTIRTSAADNEWRSVTYGNGLFVAVAPTGTGNRVMTSPDGINWTIQTSAADNEWRSVTYGNGLFVAVASTGASNRVMTSPDGINWTIRTSGVNNSWYSVTYGNGLYVAVAITGTGNRVMTSANGINWSTRTSAANNSWQSVTYANGLYVAMAITGTGNRVMTSPNGINWTIRTSAADNQWQSVIYGNGRFVAVANSGTGNRVMTSEIAAIVWDGSESTAWQTSGNWAGNAVPTTTDIVLVPPGTPNDLVVTSPSSTPECKNLVVQNGANVALGAGHRFTLNGDLENEGAVLVKADATGIGSLITQGTISGSGSFQMEQYLTGAGGATPNGVFYYVGTPVVGSTAATYGLASGNKLWGADETTTSYPAISSEAEALTLGEGYAVRMGTSGTRTFTGTAFGNGAVNITGLTRTGTSDNDRGYNLVANPYPSTVSWADADRTNLAPTLWYRTHNGTTMLFDTYNASGGIGTNNNGNGEVTGLIAPTQGFWVRVDVDGNTGAIGFTNADRSHGTLTAIHKQEEETGTVRLVLSNPEFSGLSDETIVHFNTSAQDSYDDFDSQKMWMNNLPQLYTTIGTDSLTINGLFTIETNPVVDLGIKAATTGEHTITATSITLMEDVWLEDKALNQFQHLNVNPVYAFATNAGNIGDRFALHFGAMAVGVGGDAMNGVSTHVFAADGLVNVSVGNDITTGNITILDMMGRTVQTATITGSRTVVATDLTTGIYLVRVETTKGTETHRVMFR